MVYQKYDDSVSNGPSLADTMKGNSKFEKHDEDIEEPVNEKEHKNVIKINELAISKIKNIKSEELSENVINKLTEMHKNLLTYAMENNNSNEVVQILDINSLKETGYCLGDETSVMLDNDPELGGVIRTSEYQSLVLVHNHPRAGCFSITDIDYFMANESLKAMTIVTNKGETWSIVKTKKYNRVECAKEILKISKAIINNPSKPTYAEGKKVVEGFFKSMYNKGIERN